MTALTTPFSSQNTTIEIFNSPAATRTLVTAIATALAGSDVQADLKTAYDTFFVAATMTAATVTFSGSSGGTVSNVDGAVTGTWTQTSSGATGTWSSTASSATSTTATLTLVSGTPTTVSGASTGFTFSVTSGAYPSTPTYSISLTAPTGTGSKIGKITAAGDTGKTYAGISAKLLNESGTMKAKGSSDEGDFTIDFLNTPGDPGQLAMTTAFNDESANANRVFRIIHGSSNDGTITNGEMVYFVGMVTELKKTRGAIDNYVSVKSKISIQNGLYEYNPA